MCITFEFIINIFIIYSKKKNSFQNLYILIYSYYIYYILNLKISLAHNNDILYYYSVCLLYTNKGCDTTQQNFIINNNAKW